MNFILKLYLREVFGLHFSLQKKCGDHLEKKIAACNRCSCESDWVFWIFGREWKVGMMGVKMREKVSNFVRVIEYYGQP